MLRKFNHLSFLMEEVEWKLSREAPTYIDRISRSEYEKYENGPEHGPRTTNPSEPKTLQVRKW